MKAPQPKKEILIDKTGILGVSKTAVGKQYCLIGESKTIIPDLSPYIQPEDTEVTNDVSRSICISLVDEDTDEVDLSEEEIKLDMVQVTATGVSIEDIETMNTSEKESEILTPQRKKRISNTAGVLSGTELTLNSDPTFSEKLHSLLENCEPGVSVAECVGNRSTDVEIDELFN